MMQRVRNSQYRADRTFRAIALALIAWLAGTIALAGPVTSKAIEADILGLPDVIYVGEELNFTVRLVNGSASSADVVVVYAQGGKQELRSARKVGAGQEVTAVIPISVTGREIDGNGDLEVRAGDDPAVRILNERIAFRDIKGSLEGLVWDREGWRDESGARVILVARHEMDRAYRRWAPLKWVGRTLRSRGAVHVAVGPDWLRSTVEQAHPQADAAEKWQFVPYSGNALAASLDLERKIPTDVPVRLALILGEAQSETLRPRKFGRALDVAVDRARRASPRIEIILTTPPPLPGEEELNEAYADEIRRIGREHHIPVVDWHARVLALDDWERLYALDGDPLVLAETPGPEGRQLLLEWLEEAMK